MLFCRITIEKISKKLEKLLFKIIFPMYNSKVCTKQTLIYFQNFLKRLTIRLISKNSTAVTAAEVILPSQRANALCDDFLREMACHYPL